MERNRFAHFCRDDGANPASGLIFDTAAISTALRSTARWRRNRLRTEPIRRPLDEQIIYSITQPELVGLPNGLIMDGAGNIFGTTYYTVFELLPNGSGGWNPAVLHNFAGGPRDGAYAVAHSYSTRPETSTARRSWAARTARNFLDLERSTS